MNNSKIKLFLNNNFHLPYLYFVLSTSLTDAFFNKCGNIAYSSSLICEAGLYLVWVQGACPEPHILVFQEEFWLFDQPPRRSQCLASFLLLILIKYIISISKIIPKYTITFINIGIWKNTSNRIVKPKPMVGIKKKTFFIKFLISLPLITFK